jgi:mannosyl-oligosaccharide alpha-1,2-mannosidase
MSRFRARRLIHTSACLFILCILCYILLLRSASHQGPYSGQVFVPRPSPRVRAGVQHDFAHSHPREQINRLQEVKEEYVHAWNGYKKPAWWNSGPPLDGGYNSEICSHAATLVNNLDAFYIMGMEVQWDEAVQGVSMFNFTLLSEECHGSAAEEAGMFLAGLLAAYDLDGNEMLRQNALEVGEVLWAAIGPEIPLAGLLPWSLEFARLSAMTGVVEYVNAVSRLADEMERRQENSAIPGLWPTEMDTCPGGVCPSALSTFSFGSDAPSPYEYILKVQSPPAPQSTLVQLTLPIQSHFLLGLQNFVHKTMWVKARDLLVQHALFKPMTPSDHSIRFSGTIVPPNSINLPLNLLPAIHHKSCLLGALFTLSSRLSPRHSDDLATARKLTNGCLWAHHATPSRLMPSRFKLTTCPSADQPCPFSPSRWVEEFREENESESPDQNQDMAIPNLPEGFVSVTDSQHLLDSSSTIESVLVMYRLTGDPAWREAGWKLFTAIRAHTHVQGGHSGLDDAMKDIPGHLNETGGLGLVKSLKLFYLLFVDPAVVSLDEYVLSSSGHPLRRGR